MWVTKGRVWYSEEEIQKIMEHCQETIELYRVSSGYDGYAQGRMQQAEQVIELIKEMNK